MNILKVVKYVKTITVVFLFCGTLRVSAQLTLPKIFSDGMVLQRNEQVKVFGKDIPLTKVSIGGSWGESTTVTVSDDGNWMADLQTPEAGGPYNVTISGSSNITYNDVFIGEVWFASGQSNMQRSVSAAGKVEQEAIANSTNTNLHLFTVGLKTEFAPQDDILSGSWVTANPSTVTDFSAVAYFFSKMLQDSLDIPIGIISCAWGASSLEAWMSKELLQTFNFITVPNVYESTKQKTPRVCFNGMVNPIIGYGIKGVIWYQGEANRDRAEEHTQIFPAMIQSWRDLWGYGDFPFYFVQIAPFRDISPPIRESQLVSYQNTQNTGMVVTQDVGDCADIHPGRKKPVGDRLAFWALNHNYGFNNLTYSGPLYKRVEVRNDTIEVFFDFVDDGLVLNDEGDAKFEMAESNDYFFDATAKIFSDSSIIVTCPSVSIPASVRYAWENCVSSTFFNGAGLPASCFRATVALNDDEPDNRGTIRIGSNGTYNKVWTADSLSKVVSYLQSRQDEGFIFDTVFFSGEITNSTGLTFSAGYKYVFKGEGMNNTFVQPFTNSFLAKNPTALATDSYYFWLQKGSEVHFVDMTLRNMRTETTTAFIYASASILACKGVRMTNNWSSKTGSSSPCIVTNNATYLTLEDCLIDKNTTNGGASPAIHNVATGVSTYNFNIHNTVFKDNTATGATKHAALSFYTAKANVFNINITKSVFFNNAAEASTASAAIGLACKGSVNGAFINNTIAYNRGLASIYFVHPSTALTFVNNVIYGTRNYADNTNMNDIDITFTNFTGGVFAGDIISLENNTIGKVAEALFANINTNSNNIFNPSGIGIIKSVNSDNKIIPAYGSLLIDAGKVLTPYTDGFEGSAPDIGVYETNYIIPNAPSNLTTEQVSHVSATLKWSDNSDDESGFVICINNAPVDTTEADIVSYIVTDLAEETEYVFGVFAYCIGNSDTIMTTVTTLENQTSLAQYEINNQIIAPNPVEDILYIKSESAVQWYIFNMSGQKIKDGFGTQVSVAEIPKGKYIIKFSQENQLNSVTVFIKK